MDENLNPVNAGQEANVEPQIEQNAQPVNAGIEGVATQSRAAQSAEDNAKYAAIRREAETKAREKARDELISEMYGQSHGIHTYAEYKKAYEEAQRQAEIDRLVQQNIPKEYAEKLTKVDELEKWRAETERQRQESEAKSKTESEEKARLEKANNEFFKMFKDENGRSFDPETDKLAPELVVYLNQGMSIDYAYSRYLNDQRRLASQTNQANHKAASTSTGSATSKGPTNATALTPEMVENMSPQELAQRWSEVRKLYKMQ